MKILLITLMFGSIQLPLLHGQKIVPDTLEAASLLLLQDTLMNAGQFQDAFNTVEEAQTIYYKYQIWDKYVHCYILMAQISDEIDYHLKAKMADQALYSAQKYLSENHTLAAMALRQKGEVHLAFSRFDSSAYFLEKAIPVFESNKAWEDLVWCEILLAINGLYSGQFEKCENHLISTERLINNYVPDESARAAMYSIYGGLYDQQGDYEKSIQITTRALDYFLKKSQKNYSDSTHIANNFNNLGKWYDLKGDHQRASDYFIKAFHIYQHLENVLEEKIIACISIGILYAKQNQFKKALEYYRKSERLLEAFKNYTNYQQHLASCYTEMSAAFKALGQYDNAFHYSNRAVNFSTNDKKYLALSGLANLYIKIANPDKAIPLLLKAKNLYLEDKQPEEFLLPLIFKNLGDAFQQKKIFDKALYYYQQSLIANCPGFTDSIDYTQNPDWKTVYNPKIYLESLQAKAKTWSSNSEEANHLEIALNTYQKAIAVLDSLRVHFTLDGSSLLWSEKIKPVFGEAIHVAHQLYLSSNDEQYLHLGFNYFEKSKATLLLEALQASEERNYAGLPDSLVNLERNLNINLVFYEKMLLQSNSDNVRKMLYRNYLSETRLQLASLMEKMESEYPEYFQLKYQRQEATINLVKKEILDNATAMLSYFMTDSLAYVFVITKDKIELLPLPKSNKINTTTLAFQHVLTNPLTFQLNAKKAFKDYNEKSWQLYQLVLKPALHILPPKIQKLIVTPDGYLNNIPFEALTQDLVNQPEIDFAKLPYLLKQYQISYTLSAALLHKNYQRQKELPANSQCIALAPPYKEENTRLSNKQVDEARNTSSQLKGTSNEIQAIAKYYDGYFNRSNSADESEFKKIASDYGIIHLAMHGKADYEHFNFAYLEFTNMGKNEKDDNRLHHYEITNLQLSAHLVVLSACETGRGQYVEGEGVFSLARSFMYAGVPSVLMSLWKVNDQSTSLLMPLFYKYLAKGNPKDVALHQAKTAFLEETNLKFRHPYYWSGFVLLGSQEAIEKSNIYFGWLAVVSMLLLLGILWKKVAN